MTVGEFIALPFNKQIHLCTMRYLATQGQTPFKNGKPTGDYFKCRAYLWKLDRQIIKNIYFMLEEQKCFLYDLEKKAKEFVRKKQGEESEKAVGNTKDYDIDLEGFLNG